MDTQNHKHFFTFIFVFLSLIFLILSLSLFWRLKKTKPQTQPSSTTVTKLSPTQKPVVKEKGRLILKVKNNQTVISQNNLLTLYLYASSDNQPIIGYDAVLNYDQESVDFVNHNNFLPEFQVFVKKDKNQLVITGVKNLNSTQPVIFDNTSLIELTFQPKKTGQVNFSFEFLPQSKKESNLINENTTDILGGVEGIIINIGEELILTKNRIIPLPGSKLALRLVEVIKSNERCVDCISSTKIEVKKENQIKEIEFKIGGIVGYLVDQQEAFGYQFKLETLEENSVKLIFFLK